MALYDDGHERTVTINLNDLGNTDLRRIYQILSDLEDENQATEIWLHVGETGEARAQSSKNCGDPETASWFEEIAEEYAALFAEDEDEDEDEEEQDEENSKPAATYPGYIEALVDAWRSDPANKNTEAALAANAEDVKRDPNNLYRAGVADGLVEAAAWQIYANSEIDDIVAIRAAVFHAYGLLF